jgi:hypothetical protein
MKRNWKDLIVNIIPAILVLCMIVGKYQFGWAISWWAITAPYWLPAAFVVGFALLLVALVGGAGLFLMVSYGIVIALDYIRRIPKKLMHRTFCKGNPIKGLHAIEPYTYRGEMERGAYTCRKCGRMFFD